eukprot:1157395-Pelagomonas_calceolata.AAC.8
MEGALQQYDGLLCPAAPTLAYRFGGGSLQQCDSLLCPAAPTLAYRFGVSEAVMAALGSGTHDRVREAVMAVLPFGTHDRVVPCNNGVVPCNKEVAPCNNGVVTCNNGVVLFIHGVVFCNSGVFSCAVLPPPWHTALGGTAERRQKAVVLITEEIQSEDKSGPCSRQGLQSEGKRWQCSKQRKYRAKNKAKNKGGGCAHNRGNAEQRRREVALKEFESRMRWEDMQAKRPKKSKYSPPLSPHFLQSTLQQPISYFLGQAHLNLPQFTAAQLNTVHP